MERTEITRHDAVQPPAGQSPWVAGQGQQREAAAARAAGEHTMQDDARKQAVVREVHDRAFVALGLL